jgi:hypothetical protein
MNAFWSMLAGAGGASVIIIGLSTWLGKVWAGRILEKEKSIFAKELAADKHKYSLALEEVKREYEIQVESVKTILLRYSEKQFDIYGELWVSLCNLKKSMDELWSEYSVKKVKDFSSQINEAKFYLEKSSLFIDDNHLNTIKEALYQLDEFAHGKGELTKIPSNQINQRRNIIDNNRYKKNEYDNMLDNLRSYFKNKISGT